MSADEGRSATCERCGGGLTPDVCEPCFRTPESGRVASGSQPSTHAPDVSALPDAASGRTATCECGDYRHQHAGPDNRGSCRVCRDGTPPPLGADGCQRFRVTPPASTQTP